MFNHIRYGMSALSMLLPMAIQAQIINNSLEGVSAARVCDVTFSTIPTFTSLCTSVVESGTYTITNNTPVSLKLNYIRIENLDALPDSSTAIVAAPTNNCATTLA